MYALGFAGTCMLMLCSTNTVTLVLALAVFVLLLLFLVYQRRIEDWLRPAADWMHEYVEFSSLPLSIALARHRTIAD